MATFSFRSGRRLLRCAAASAVDAEVATAALCHRQVRPLAYLSVDSSAVARSSSWFCNPQVDIATPVIVPRQIQLLFPHIDRMIPAIPRRVASLAGDVRTISGSSSAPDQPQFETATPVIVRSYVRSVPPIPGARPGIASVYSRRYDQQIYPGTATSFQRLMSSTASHCDTEPEKVTLKGSDDNKPDPTVLDSVTEKTDVCKYDKDPLMSRFDKIDSDVFEVKTKVDGVDSKIEKNIADCARLTKEVELLKKKQEGSGDWTSFRIGGKNLNWLSVGSTAWEIFKAYFKGG